MAFKEKTWFQNIQGCILLNKQLFKIFQIMEGSQNRLTQWCSGLFSVKLGELRREKRNERPTKDFLKKIIKN